MLRGKVITDRGALLGTPVDGQLVRRKIEAAVLARPVC
jgi:hypothetical protein